VTDLRTAIATAYTVNLSAEPAEWITVELTCLARRGPHAPEHDINRLLAGERLSFATPRHFGRRFALDVVAAATIANGDPVIFADEAARQRALALLDRCEDAL
jgi:hypothetical protein